MNVRLDLDDGRVLVHTLTADSKRLRLTIMDISTNRRGYEAYIDLTYDESARLMSAIRTVRQEIGS